MNRRPVNVRIGKAQPRGAARKAHEPAPEPARCRDCDAVMATQADYDTVKTGEGEHLCWRVWCDDRCQRPAVDWRQRALDLQRGLGQALEHWDTSVTEWVRQYASPAAVTAQKLAKAWIGELRRLLVR